MQKRLKYVPVGVTATPIAFSSTKGNVTFEKVGDEQTIALDVYEQLLIDSNEFKNCIEMRVIVTSDVPEAVVKAGEEASEKELTDTSEQLSATPKKSSKTS